MTLDLRRRGVLLVNQGSPDSWSVKDTRKYLKNFLMDNHVLDIPFIFRKLIVNFFMPRVTRKFGGRPVHPL
jgi:ferrochelatase